MADSITHYITAKRIADNHKEFSKEFIRGFNFGSQGPDIFFFQGSKDGFVFGDSVHDVVPKDLFEKGEKQLANHGDLYKGYYFGMLVHYFGDRIIHQYIGHLITKYPSKYAHGEFEKDIDMCVYQREFGKKISTFDYKKNFKIDKELIDEVYRYWVESVESEFLTYEFVEKSIKQLCAMTKHLIKPSKLYVLIVKLVEKKKKMEGMLSCHIKQNGEEFCMNDKCESWKKKSGVVNFSVEDMLQLAVDDFESEYLYITNCLINQEEYVFRFNEEFSCGKNGEYA